MVLERRSYVYTPTESERERMREIDADINSGELECDINPKAVDGLTPEESALRPAALLEMVQSEAQEGKRFGPGPDTEEAFKSRYLELSRKLANAEIEFVKK